MKEINELLHKALETKLEDGSFDKIVSEYLERSIKSIMEKMFERSWNPEKNPHGEAYAYLETIIQPLVMKSLEDCNLNHIAKKTKLAMNAIIEQCSIAQYGNALAKATGLFGQPEDIEWKQLYSMKKILQAYVETIQSETYEFDREWFLDNDYEIEEGKAYLECSMSIEDIETKSWTTVSDKKLVTLYIEGLDEDENHAIQFIIYRDYSSGWRVDYMQFKAFGFDELKRMNSVELLLRKLASSYAILTDISESSANAEFNDLYE